MQHCQCVWSLRQCAKLFREFLNHTCVEKIDQGRNSRGQVYVRRTRGYGDYLYSQDREMFDFEFSDTKDGREFGKWLASREGAYLNPHCLNDGKPCNPNGNGGCVSCDRKFSGNT